VRVHRIDQATPARNELQSGVEQAAVQAVFEGLVKIANRPEFFLDVALLDFSRKGTQSLRRGIARLERLEDSLRRQHPALDRHMDALKSL